jgi:CRP/FNR family transcriptional regulator, cyclic AMP receptor protein
MVQPLDRFTGTENLRTLEEALRDQFLVHGNAEIASEIAAVAVLKQHSAGTSIISQDGADNDIYFILVGDVSIVINGQEINRRHVKQHVGEMALLDAGARRSASIVARDTVVTAMVNERSFSAIAAKHPSLWRRIAAALGDRLRQRTALIRPKNETPILFIGSSSESLPVSEALLEGLKARPFISRLWNRGVFSPSQFPIDDLAKQLAQVDFAALVLGRDDQVISRAVTSDAPRDNVVLELGLFMGALGRPRTFLIVPREVDVKIPTDLLGLTPIRFSLKDQSLAKGLKPVCEQLADVIRDIGAR